MRPKDNKTKLGVKQEPKPGFGFVYALCDPRNPKTPKYVGRTICDLRRRLAGHLCGKQCQNAELKAWVESLLIENLFPTIYVLETMPLSEMKPREEAWIAFFKPLGLLNRSNGDGMKGLKGYVSPLNRAITAKRNRLGHSPEVREKLRLINLGKKLSEETKSKMWASDGYAISKKKFAACNDSKRISVKCLETGQIIDGRCIAEKLLKRGWPKILSCISANKKLDGKTWEILQKEKI